MSEKPLLLNRACLDLGKFVGSDEQPAAGVHVTPTHTEATNGHMLLRVPMSEIDPAEWPETAGPSEGGATPTSILIPTESAAAMLKAIPPRPYLPILAHAAVWVVEGGVEAHTTDTETQGVVRAKPVGGKFPDADKVIPLATKDRAVTLNAAYLKALCEWAIKYGEKCPQPTVTLQLGEDGAADCVRIEIQMPDGREAIGVIMPIRRERKSDQGGGK